MNTTELIAKLAEAHGVSKAQAKSIVDDIFKDIVDADGERRGSFCCRGSGSSKSRRRRKLREGRNPANGRKRSRLRRQRSSLSRPPNRSKDLLNGRGRATRQLKLEQARVLQFERKFAVAGVGLSIGKPKLASKKCNLRAFRADSGASARGRGAPIGRAAGDIVFGGRPRDRDSLHRVGRKRPVELLAVAAAGDRMRLVLSAIWIAFFALLGPARAESADTALSAAIDGAWREPQSRARDAYRHPYESLTFWGLKPGMTVVEVDPGVRGMVERDSRALRPRNGGRIYCGPARSCAGRRRGDAMKLRSARCSW